MLPRPTELLIALSALATVMAVLWLLYEGMRLGGFRRRQRGARTLRVLESAALDPRRRLHLVACGARRVLLLTGGGADLVVGWVEREEGAASSPGEAGVSGPTSRSLRPQIVMAGLDPAIHAGTIGPGVTATVPPSWPAETHASSWPAEAGHPRLYYGKTKEDMDGRPSPALTVGARVPALTQGAPAPSPATTVLIVLSVLLLTPALAHAQALSIDLGAPGQAGVTSRIVQLTALIGVLSLAPSLLVMLTAFTRIIIVLSLLRSALSTQGTPPNMVLIGLALFLTFFVMQPVLDQAWTAGLAPMAAGRIGEIEGMRLAAAPFHKFMTDNLRPADLRFFLDLGHLPMPGAPDQASWRAVVPAFLVGELRRAFEMGFLLFLPFLVIDMVVASVLMSLGMMMLPPNVVSLPFKLIFFVMVDGWRLVAGSLVQSFGGG